MVTSGSLAFGLKLGVMSSVPLVLRSLALDGIISSSFLVLQLAYDRS